MKRIKMTALLLSAGLITTACGGAGGSTTAAPGNESGTSGGASQISGSSQSGSTGNITGEISVSCYDSILYQTFLEEAGRMFEEAYPGTKVNINCFSSMPEIKTSEQEGEQMSAIMVEDDPQGRADYISKTSTALMSGNGPDLMAMDVLPLHKYVESGQLENIKTLIDNDADFDRSAYRGNVLTGAESQGGMWYLPLNYGFDYFTYDSTLLDAQHQTGFGLSEARTLAQMTEVGKTVFDGTNYILPTRAYSQDGESSLFNRMFWENYDSFVNLDMKKANFDDGKFKDMLTGIKALEDEELIKRSLTEAISMDDLMKSATDQPTGRYLFKPKNHFNLIGETFSAGGESLMFSTANMDTGIVTEDEIGGIMAYADGVVPFYCEQAFAMNANSTNKDTAWAFLKFLLSYEVQVNPNMTMISQPLHNEARRDKAEAMYSMFFAGGGELDATLKKDLNSYTEVVEAMSEQLNRCTIWDTTIEDMVVQEAKHYFDGSKSADEVCRTLQSKVGLYLDE